MTSEIRNIPLGDVVSLVIDYRGKTPKKLGSDWATHGFRALSAKNIKTGQIVQHESIRFADADLYKRWMKDEIQRRDILITSEAPFGEVYLWDSDEKIVLSQRLFALRCKSDFYPPYVYYYMTSTQFQGELRGRATGTTVTGLRQPELLKCLINCPNYHEQQQIADTLAAVDALIAENRKINHHLEQMAQAIFKSWFVSFEPFGGEMPAAWITGKAEDFFEIAIGKTPPRKEPEWFTTNPQDVVWVSISDMGSCGMFISDSSEYLTAESVERFNVRIVPSGTAILSFKLTVGRVAITDGEMATNEAIAHFKQANKVTLEYLYCYLKAFDYQSLGNTSSIATAVNSKTIKAMPFVMPDEKVLTDFHATTAPLFEQVRTKLAENARLAALRDALLPRLMSGELSVADFSDAK